MVRGGYFEGTWRSVRTWVVVAFPASQASRKESRVTGVIFLDKIANLERHL